MGTRFWRLLHLIMQRALYNVIRNSLIFGCLLLATFAINARANEQKMLVLGDSISAAYGMSLQQGWVAQLSDELREQYPALSVVNASISGETTAGGLRRLPALLEQHNPSLVIIELGANDGLRGYPLQTLRNNLTALATLAQGNGAKVILVPMEIPPNYGSRYTAGFRDSFREVAKETDSVLAPFLLDGVATNPKLMQADGLHPTVQAQPLMLANILPTVTATLADQ
jgi:acyl-CoA thioesterase I